LRICANANITEIRQITEPPAVIKIFRRTYTISGSETLLLLLEVGKQSRSWKMGDQRFDDLRLSLLYLTEICRYNLTSACIILYFVVYHGLWLVPDVHCIAFIAFDMPVRVGLGRIAPPTLYDMPLNNL
jgi:hypothetical protein